MRQSDITAFSHTRKASLLMALIAVAATLVAYMRGDVTPIIGNRGLAFLSANEWLDPGATSLWINLALNIGIVILSTTLNKTFNIMRSLTALWGSLFIVMQCALPMFIGQFYGGTLLCLIMIGIIALMFSVYGYTDRRRRIFMIFFLLSAASFIQYAFMFYIPVLLIGLVQMRALNPRSFVAAFIGIVTPPWILIGSGIISISDLRWPEFISTLTVLDRPEMIHTFSTIGVTVLTGIVFLCGNFMKLLSYNARFRAYNGFLTLLMSATILLIFIDYSNLSIYVPLLNFTAAYQIAHFFSNRRSRGSYIPIALIVMLYLLLYTTAIMI